MSWRRLLPLCVVLCLPSLASAQVPPEKCEATFTVSAPGALGGSSTPIPWRATLCGLPSALSLKVRLAVRLPLAPGLKRRLKLREAPGARSGPPLPAPRAKLLDAASCSAKRAGAVRSARRHPVGRDPSPETNRAAARRTPRSTPGPRIRSDQDAGG